VLACASQPEKQKGSLDERPSIDQVAAPAKVAAPAAAAGSASKQPLAFLKTQAAPAAALQIDDPKLVQELRAATHDALVSEVILALSDRSLPLHMRDTSAALLRAFRSQDAAARNLALEIAAQVATGGSAEIGKLGAALNSRLDTFVETFRESAASPAAAGGTAAAAGAWGGAAAAGAAAATSAAAAVDPVDDNLFRALNTFAAAITARQVKVASTSTADGAEYALDSAALSRFAAGTLFAPSDAGRRAAGAALCAVVAAQLQNDPAGTMRPQVLAWAKDSCTAAVDAVIDAGASAAGGGGAREYLVAFFARALGAAFVFHVCGLSAVLHHARAHFGQAGFPTRQLASLLTLVLEVGGRSALPFLTNPERFLMLEIIVDLCGRGEELRLLALAAARQLVSRIHLVDLDETMGYLLKTASTR
jgi:hypothetical protein